MLIKRIITLSTSAHIHESLVAVVAAMAKRKMKMLMKVTGFAVVVIVVLAALTFGWQ